MGVDGGRGKRKGLDGILVYFLESVSELLDRRKNQNGNFVWGDVSGKLIVNC